MKSLQQKAEVFDKHRCDSPDSGRCDPTGYSHGWDAKEEIVLLAVQELKDEIKVILGWNYYNGRFDDLYESIPKAVDNHIGGEKK